MALPDTLSFRKAAEACSVSQPGLSVQLKELERMLEVRLFERDRRKVLLTAAGKRIVQAARQILAEVEGLVESARSLKNPLAGVLRLGVIPTVAPYLLPRIMPAVHRKYPDLRLFLREEQTRTLVELAREGQLDLLLLALEAELGDLETAPLFADPFVLALSAAHPLARRKVVCEKDLRGEQILLLTDGHCLRGQTAPICESADACELADFRATSLSTLVQMVASGIGVTLLPRMALEAEVGSRKGLTARKFAATAPARTIGFAWRRSSPYRGTFLLLGEVFKGILGPERVQGRDHALPESASFGLTAP